MERRIKPRSGERGGQLLEYALMLAFFLVLATLAADYASRSGFSIDDPLGRTANVLERILDSLSGLFSSGARLFR